MSDMEAVLHNCPRDCMCVVRCMEQERVKPGWKNCRPWNVTSSTVERPMPARMLALHCCKSAMQFVFALL